MARAFRRLLLPVIMAAAGCGGSEDGAAAGAQGDSAQRAAASAAGRDTARAREEVRRLAEDLLHAFVRGDSAPAARLLAEDYEGFSGDGFRETRAQALANMRRDTTPSAGAARDSLQLDSVTVRVYGDAAVAQASGTLPTRSRGQPVTVGIRNTDVFAWRDGRWQIVATHLSQAAAAQGGSRTP